MSYHSPKSDINHLYRHISGEYRCCRCLLNESEKMEVESYDGDGMIEITHYGDNTFDHPSEVLDHLKRHREAGHQVAESTFERLRSEAENWKH